MQRKLFFVTELFNITVNDFGADKKSVRCKRELVLTELVESGLRCIPYHVLCSAELPDALPEGCVPIFLATKTQEIFSVRMDEDIKATAPYRLIKKEELLKDIFNQAAVSDFQPFKKIIEVPFEFKSINQHVNNLLQWQI